MTKQISNQKTEANMQENRKSSKEWKNYCKRTIWRTIKKYKYYIITLLAVISAIGLCALNFYMVKDKPCDERGTFGDMFGAVNALFSGLAFAGLIVTLMMQHEELGLQRKEIAQTNKELAAQQKEFEEQTKTMKIQRFESTLFNMLTIQQNILNSLFYQTSEHNNIQETINGRKLFDFFYNEKYIIIIQPKLICKEIGIKNIIKRYNEHTFYELVDNISIFDNYFRHLYRIFKYIDQSPLIEKKDRYEYTCIVRAQLSDYELVMLFYNALNVNDNGEYKFKKLIEKYAIFNNLRKDLLARGDNDCVLYCEGAYSYQEEKES